MLIHKVDLETGALTEVASLTMSGLSSTRIDHVSILGDVVSGDFTVFGAVSKSNIVVHWIFEDGEEVASTTSTLKSFYPTNATAMGIAPVVIPLSENDVFISGGDMHLTRYNLSTGRVADSFANKTALTPEGFEINGGAYFTLNNQNYLIYPYSDYNTIGHAYNLTKVNSNYDYSSMELMWEFPKGSIGSVNSSTMQAEVDYVYGTEGIVYVYVYVPGNGIAAYMLNDTSASGIETVMAQNDNITIKGNVLNIGDVVDHVAVYNLYGMQLIEENNVSSIELKLPCGVYVIEIENDGNVLTKKVIIK